MSGAADRRRRAPRLGSESSSKAALGLTEPQAGRGRFRSTLRNSAGCQRCTAHQERNSVCVQGDQGGLRSSRDTLGVAQPHQIHKPLWAAAPRVTGWHRSWLKLSATWISVTLLRFHCRFRGCGSRSQRSCASARTSRSRRAFRCPEAHLLSVKLRQPSAFRT